MAITIPYSLQYVVHIVVRGLFSNSGLIMPSPFSSALCVVKNLPADAEDVRDAGSVPGSGRSLEEGMATHSSILAWRTPWTGEPGGLQSIESQRVRHK